MFSLAKITGRLWSLLPSGGSLPEDVWGRRHRFLLGLTWLHAAIIAVLGKLLGYRWELSFAALLDDATALHTIGAGLIVAFFALAAEWKGATRSFRATMVGFGLMTSSAIFVHLAGGTIELHFHFFVMLAFLALYQDWRPYIFAVVYVAVHHGVLGALWPEEVYNHAAAFDAPWTWAGIHAFFVFWASVGGIVAWRFNETSFARTKLILDVAGDGIYGLDADGKITFANYAAARMLGMKRRAMIAQPIQQIVSHLRANGSQFPDGISPILLALKNGTTCVSSDEIFRRKDGTSLVVDYVSNPIFERGSFTGAVVAFTDVTHRKRSEDALQARYKEVAILHEVGQIIFSSTDLKAVLGKILERALSVVSLDLGNIRLFERDGQMQTGASQGYRDPERLGKHGGLDTGSFVRGVVASRKSLAVEDVSRAEGLRNFKSEGARSAIIVPITTAEETLGIIEVGSRALRKFSLEEVRLLEALGNQIGIAVQKARLFEEAEQRAQEQAALNSIAFATSHSLRLDETLQIALDKVLEVMGREQAYIRMKDPVTGNLTLAAHRGISEQFVETLIEARTPGGKSDRVFESGEPLVINNPEASSLKDQTRREGSRAFVWVPLMVRGRAVGIMNVATARPLPFQPREVELLKAIGNVIGVALENARLFQETEQKARHLSALHTVASTVSASLDLDQLVAKALDIILEVTGMDAGDIRLLEGDPPRLDIKVHKGVSWELVKKLRRGTGAGGKAQQVLTTRRSLVFESTQTSGLEMPPQVLSEGFTAVVWVPIISRDKAFGIIAVAARGHRTFNRNQLPLLEAIGASLGVALDNARLFRELGKKAEELARSNADLQHFAYIASHDLQEPLRMVASYVQLLARRYKDKLDQDANEFIGFAVDGATRMQALINALLTYSRVGSQAKKFEPTYCEEVLDGTLAGLKTAVEESGAEITRDPLPTVMGDATQLGQLFQNLIGNGIKFRGAEAPRIHVGCKRNGKGWIFSVQDHGIGFDSRYAERIFVMFQRLHAKGEYPGTGIGLAVCKKIVERHGGEIWVESRPGEGATFYFTIPTNGHEEEKNEHATSERERIG